MLLRVRDVYALASGKQMPSKWQGTPDGGLGAGRMLWLDQPRQAPPGERQDLGLDARSDAPTVPVSLV
jgi:hypothetical protein